MSLINDALKRAEQNQSPTPPPPIPQLRPVEAQDLPSASSGLLVPILILLVTIGAAIGIWQFSKSRGQTAKPEMEVRALAVDPAPVTPNQAPEPVPKAPAAPTVAPTPPNASANKTTSTTVSNTLPIAAPTAPSPPLKLQSILYSRRPSAMISGVIVGKGDKIKGYTVTDIKQNQVTLSANGETILLTLP
jgi:hypothetical protein